MPTREADLFWVMLLYAIAAISGGMGGMASAIYYIRHGQRRAGVALICAYTVMGLVFGIVTLAALAAYNYKIGDLHHLIIYAISGGASGSIALASANWTVRAVFKKFGIDVELTFRRSVEEKEGMPAHTQERRSEGNDPDV